MTSVLDRFERALPHLPPRVATRTVREIDRDRASRKSSPNGAKSFRTDSIVRPLIAENLALGRPWYAGFVRLMTRINPASGKPYRDQLSFERKGLHAMIADDRCGTTAGERLVVQAVHEAIRGRYGQIADENKTNPGGHEEPLRWRVRPLAAGLRRGQDAPTSSARPCATCSAAPAATRSCRSGWQDGPADAPGRQLATRPRPRPARPVQLPGPRRSEADNQPESN